MLYKTKLAKFEVLISGAFVARVRVGRRRRGCAHAWWRGNRGGRVSRPASGERPTPVVPDGRATHPTGTTRVHRGYIAVTSRKHYDPSFMITRVLRPLGVFSSNFDVLIFSTVYCETDIASI